MSRIWHKVGGRRTIESITKFVERRGGHVLGVHKGSDDREYVQSEVKAVLCRGDKSIELRSLDTKEMRGTFLDWHYEVAGMNGSKIWGKPVVDLLGPLGLIVGFNSRPKAV